MKKLLIICLLFCTQLFYAQVSGVKVVRVANATTTFSQNLPAGTQVFNVATGELWVATAAVLNTATLTTASGSFNAVNDGKLNIATIADINTGTNDSKAISPNGLANSDLAADVTTNNGKVSFPGFTSLLSDYSFTDNSSDWNTAFGWGDHGVAGYANLTGTQSFTGVNTFDPTSNNKLKVGTNDWFTITETSGFGSIYWWANYDGTTSNLFARHASKKAIEVTQEIDSKGIEINTYVNNGEDALVGAKTQVAEISEDEFTYLGNKVDVLPSNKTWVLYGDSMVNSLTGDWIGVTMDSLGVVSGNVTINAVAGDKIVDQLTDLDADLAGDANYFDSFDNVLLSVGVNDFAGSSVLGDISDTSADATVVGYFKDFIEKVYTSNPEIKFYITTPLQYTNATFGYNGANYDGWTLAQLANIISKICAEYSVSCIDLYNTSGFNSVTDDTLSDDPTPLHPNALGKVVVGNEAYRAIKGGTSYGNMFPYDDVFRAPLKMAQGQNSVATKLELENYDVSLLQDEFVGRIDFITNDSNSGNGVAGSITSVLEDAGFWYGLGFNVKSSASEYEALRLSYNGVVSAPAMTNAEITAKGNTALITKDYFDTNNAADDDDGVAEVYGSGWDGDTQAPTKNDVYDKFESLTTGDYIANASKVVSEYENRVIGAAGTIDNRDQFDYDAESLSNESIQITPNGVAVSKLFGLEVSDPIAGTDADLNFSRATTATRINSVGVVETIASNVPRVDYTNTPSGVLLIEPSTTNDLLRSNEFDNASWTKTNATVSASSTFSPEGIVNAYSLIEDNTTGTHEIRQYKSGLTNSVDHTFSVFAKANERYKVRLNTFSGYAEFDLSNGTIITQPTVDDAAIVAIGNGWYRISITKTANNTLTNSYIYILNDAGSVSYAGDNSSGVYLYGAQLEETGFPTSYVPTTSAVVTRNAEQYDLAGSTSTINSEAGVLYIEAAALYDQVTNRHVSLSDGTSSNQVIVGYDAFSNRIEASYWSGGIETAKLSYVVADITNFHKIAFKYSQDDFALWVDGVERGTDTSGGVVSANTLNELQFANGAAGDQFIGKIRELKVFTKVLSDADLTVLTSKTDYTPKFLARTNVDPNFTTDVSVQGVVSANSFVGGSEMKSISIESPTATEDITLFRTTRDISITQFDAVLLGSSTPSVTYTIRYASDRSAAGTEVVTSGSTTTSTTTGNSVTSFNNASIPSGSWIWIETTAQSGTVDLFSLTLNYTKQ